MLCKIRMKVDSTKIEVEFSNFMLAAEKWFGEGWEINEIEEFLDANREKEKMYSKELEEKIEMLIAVNQTQHNERLGQLAWGAR